MDYKAREQMARKIAKELNERNHKLIAKVIRIAGKDFTDDILEQTRKIQSDGGMMTLDNKRQRSAGGVFFRLTKEQLSDELRKKVFPPKDWEAIKAKKKMKKEVKAVQETSNQPPPKASTSSEAPSPEQPTVEQSEPLSEQEQKRAQLEEAAQTLRERIAQMEAKGQKGIKMTKALLKNTEKQIAKLQ